ncbi:hypothetical protein EVAR_27153_1 [Eumeta japonica]|uniref:BED-type domain-containing protein n=1 Tax=Eumeta variegata TaxID=151549 RepID=A0A4C1W1Q1_EUMVA|nr:hypothetical protein EVAR_27153_1 [Eumeta japonica]
MSKSNADQVYVDFSSRLPVWRYFKKAVNNLTAQCQLCKAVLKTSFGSTKVYVHMMSIHKIDTKLNAGASTPEPDNVSLPSTSLASTRASSSVALSPINVEAQFSPEDGYSVLRGYEESFAAKGNNYKLPSSPNTIELIVMNYGMTLKMKMKEDLLKLKNEDYSVMKKVGRLIEPLLQLCYAHGVQLGITDVIYKKTVQSNPEEEFEDPELNTNRGGERSPRGFEFTCYCCTKLYIASRETQGASKTESPFKPVSTSLDRRDPEISGSRGIDVSNHVGSQFTISSRDCIPYERSHLVMKSPECINHHQTYGVIFTSHVDLVQVRGAKRVRIMCGNVTTVGISLSHDEVARRLRFRRKIAKTFHCEAFKCNTPRAAVQTPPSPSRWLPFYRFTRHGNFLPRAVKIWNDRRQGVFTINYDETIFKKKSVLLYECRQYTNDSPRVAGVRGRR